MSDDLSANEFFNDSFFSDFLGDDPTEAKDVPGVTSHKENKKLSEIISLEFSRENMIAPVAYSREDGSLTVLAPEAHSPELLDKLAKKSLGLRIIIRTATDSEIQQQLSALESEKLSPSDEDAQSQVPSQIHSQSQLEAESQLQEPSQSPELESLKLAQGANPPEASYAPGALSGGRCGAEGVGMSESLGNVSDNALDNAIAPSESDGTPHEGALLFITPTGSISGHMLFSLRAEGLAPVVVSSMAEARKLLRDKSFARVFVHSSFRDDYQSPLDQCDQNHSMAPAPIVIFDYEKDILLGDSTTLVAEQLVSALAKLSCELATDDPHTIQNPPAQIAELVRLLSVKHNLSPTLRLATLAAAYTHLVSLRDLAGASKYNSDDVIRLSRSRLSACGAPEIVVALLNCMINKPQETASENSQMSLAGDILSLAYAYIDLRNNSAVEDHHEKDLMISRQLRKLATSEQRKAVVESLIQNLSASTPENLNATPDIKVFALSRHPIAHRDVQKLLDIRCALLTFPSADKLVSAWKSGRPDALVIIDDRSHEEVRDLLLSLALRGVITDEQPTTLIVSPEVAGSVSWMIKSGVEDVLCGDGALDALAAKLDRMRSRWQEADRARESALHDMGTHGTLGDMNLFCLLEALRNNQRPVRLNVTAQGSQLTAFINNDRILSAECDDFTGVEAFTRCMSWKQGIWSIDPIQVEKLPAATLNKPIGSVLLEACVNFDETSQNLKVLPSDA